VSDEKEYTWLQRVVIMLVQLLIHVLILTLVGTSAVLAAMHGMNGHVLGWIAFTPCVFLLLWIARAWTYTPPVEE